jgi:hypothetical protein
MQGLISRIDFQPKIGMLSFQSDLAVQDSQGQYQILNFEARRVMNLNMELGLEKESLWLRSRLWASYSSAQASVVKSNGVSVTSARVGVDAYIDLIKNSSWDFRLLAFGFGERLTLQRDDKALENSGNELAVRKFGFNLLFVGGGLTLSW